MNTEDQLRIALSDRADRAELELEQAERVITRALSRVQPTRPQHRRAVVTGWAAAAAVAALVVVPVAVQQRTPAPATTSSRSPEVPRPTARSAPPTTSAAPPPTTGAAPTPEPVRPPTTVSSAAVAPSTARSTAASATDGSVRSSTVVNAIGVGVDRSIDWDLRADAEYVTVQMPGGMHASVTAFAPAIGFDASRIGAAQRVTVAGRPGWFGNVSVWPANGRPDPVSGKQNAASPSVAWQLGASWVIVQSDDPGVVDSAQLAELAGSLRITDRPPILRLPFTVGYLPADVAVHGFEFYQPKGSDTDPPNWQLVLASTSMSLDFSLGSAQQSNGVSTADGKPQVTPSGRHFDLEITGTGVTSGQLTRIRESTTLTPDPGGSDISWPTLRQALP